MKNLILIKLGGSVITDKSKPFCARLKTIKRLAEEIKKAKGKLKNTDLIIGHGSGSFGHIPAARYQTARGMINRESRKGFVVTSAAAIDIDRIVLNQFISVKLNVVPFSPMSFILSDFDVLTKVFLNPLLQALDLGFIPVIYGDVIFDRRKGFTIYSGEKILDILAGKLFKKYRKISVFQCGDTDGVYDLKGETVPIINANNFAKIKKAIGGSKETDVTGGMLHKVAESLKLAKKYRISTLLLNGNKKNNLLLALSGKKMVSTKITD